jgi:hypothetical protein
MELDVGWAELRVEIVAVLPKPGGNCPGRLDVLSVLWSVVVVCRDDGQGEVKSSL